MQYTLLVGNPSKAFEFGPDAGPYREQVEVSQELVSMVIGKRGATISDLKQLTGANIHVVPGGCFGCRDILQSNDC